MFNNVISSKIKNAISFLGTLIVALALIALMTHYIAAVFQPVRWPTRYYFFCMFLIAVFMKNKTAVMFFVFSLPILPDLHLQIEALRPPPVKYFVAHPGIDEVAGLCLGLWIKNIWNTKKLEPVFKQLPWPLGLLIIVITYSALTAVMHNESLNNLLDLNYLDLLGQLIQFKLINYLSIYFPVVDWMSYSFAILTITVLLPFLKTLDIASREHVIFIPLMYGLIVSAVWGIVQSFTGVGLSQVTLEYRPASFGFGAQGFQPDIHAFAAVMLVGTVGVLGFIKQIHDRNLALSYVCIGICCIALILSKSKASLLLALLISAFFAIYELRTRKIKRVNIIFGLSTIGIALATVLFLTKSFAWIDYFKELLFAPGSSFASNINKAFVYRPELFRAAFLMFADSPIFGVGQGNFFRLSTNVDLTHSLYMAQKGGEHAHNYFLQTLAETGLVGALVFIFALIWPFLQSKQSNVNLAPAMALIAIASGNIFSHSLLIRPNLIMLGVFLALVYANAESPSIKSGSKEAI